MKGDSSNGGAFSEQRSRQGLIKGLVLVYANRSCFPQKVLKVRLWWYTALRAVISKGTHCLEPLWERQVTWTPGAKRSLKWLKSERR